MDVIPNGHCDHTFHAIICVIIISSYCNKSAEFFEFSHFFGRNFDRGMSMAQQLSGPELGVQPSGLVAAMCHLAPQVFTAQRLAFIARQGDQERRIIMIRSGWAIRYRTEENGRRQIFNVLLPGDFSGIETICTGSATYTVQALTNVMYSALPTSDALALSHQDRSFMSNLLAHLVGRHVEAEHRIMALGCLSAEERIADFFVGLYDRLMSRQLIANQTFATPLTQTHIADLVGLTLVHTNRVLQRFRTGGVMSIADQIVRIENIEALRHMACAPSNPGVTAPDNRTEPPPVLRTLF